MSFLTRNHWALSEAGASVYESCGIHIHVGADQHDVKSLKNLVKKGINIYGLNTEERCGSVVAQLVGIELTHPLLE